MGPLHLAAKNGHIEVMNALQAKKLNLNVSSSKSGFTALHVAAHFGQTSAVRDLLNTMSATVATTIANKENGAEEVNVYIL